MTQFIILGAGRPFSGEKHTALRTIGSSEHVLDWPLRAVNFLNPDCHFVSGYQAKSIQSSYPEFNYIYNKEWKSTRAGWSFLSALPEKTKRNSSFLLRYSFP